MKVIVGDRRTGKTQRLLQWMHDNPEGVCITNTVLMAGTTLRQGIKAGLLTKEDKRRFVSYEQAHDGKLEGMRRPLALDNADLFFRWFFRSDPAIVTLNAVEAEVLHGPD